MERKVASLAEAWIETLLMARTASSSSGRLPRGGVDRNLGHDPDQRIAGVASLAEAWIETAWW